MDQKTKNDLVTAAAAGSVGVGCFAASSGLNDLLVSYGQDIIDIVALVAQGLGAGALAVVGIKLIPYVVKFAKHAIASWRQRQTNKTKQTAEYHKSRELATQQKGALYKGLVNAAANNKGMNSASEIHTQKVTVDVRKNIKQHEYMA